ncbi:hypothetical protein L1887_59850 [Cichorium endivia]|nr:hypothetical protein L1887_59850 [Cichorium endivia]
MPPHCSASSTRARPTNQPVQREKRVSKIRVAKMAQSRPCLARIAQAVEHGCQDWLVRSQFTALAGRPRRVKGWRREARSGSVMLRLAVGRGSEVGAMRCGC